MSLPAKNLNQEWSTNIRDHFPFPTIREKQELALKAIERAYAEGKKFIIIEAPTGIGKSGIAIAAASYAKVMSKDAYFEKGAYILSPQKTLTEQYMKDFAPMGLKELKGKANYICHYEMEGPNGSEKLDCETASLLFHDTHDGSEGDCCGYRPAKIDFLSSRIGVTNFAYYLNETNHAGQLVDRSMLVLDEGHNTENMVLGLAITEITKYRAEEVGIPYYQVPYVDPGQTEVALNWIRETYIPSAETMLHQLEREIEQAKLEKNRDKLIKASRKYNGLNQFLERLGMFTTASDHRDWLVWSEPEESRCSSCGKYFSESQEQSCKKCGQRRNMQPCRLLIKPLTATLFADQVLFSKAEKVLIMSATILNFTTFMQNLGIDPKDAICVAVDSEFPIENRPIFVEDVGSMARGKKSDTLPKLAARVADILTKRSKSKGIVHTHSYENNNYIVNYLNSVGMSNRVITHSGKIKGDRDRAVREHFTRVDEPTVIFSPSMTEGLDLKDELSRFSIITKVPYPFLDAYVKARNARDGGEWYAWQTALVMVQATGRSNRHKEDKAKHYILDGDFKRFVTRYERMFPKWWLDSLVFKG